MWIERVGVFFHFQRCNCIPIQQDRPVTGRPDTLITLSLKNNVFGHKGKYLLTSDLWKQTSTLGQSVHMCPSSQSREQAAKSLLSLPYSNLKASFIKKCNESPNRFHLLGFVEYILISVKKSVMLHKKNYIYINSVVFILQSSSVISNHVKITNNICKWTA